MSGPCKSNTLYDWMCLIYIDFSCFPNPRFCFSLLFWVRPLYIVALNQEYTSLLNWVWLKIIDTPNRWFPTKYDHSCGSFGTLILSHCQLISRCSFRFVSWLARFCGGSEFRITVALVGGSWPWATATQNGLLTLVGDVSKVPSGND